MPSFNPNLVYIMVGVLVLMIGVAFLGSDRSPLHPTR